MWPFTTTNTYINISFRNKQKCENTDKLLVNEFNKTIKHSFKKNTSSVNHDSRPVASFGQSYIVLYQAVAPFSPLQKSMTHKAHFQNFYDS